ncbi:MAG: VOC family protein, partial [Candidatus Hydrogenedentota bacterium]
MGTSHKPAGYNSVSPYLIVDGAERTIEFLKAAFGATEIQKVTGLGGRIMHAEVRLDDTVIMIA